MSGVLSPGLGLSPVMCSRPGMTDSEGLTPPTKTVCYERSLNPLTKISTHRLKSCITVHAYMLLSPGLEQKPLSLTFATIRGWGGGLRHLPQVRVSPDSVLFQGRRGEDHTRRKDVWKAVFESHSPNI